MCCLASRAGVLSLSLPQATGRTSDERVAAGGLLWPLRFQRPRRTEPIRAPMCALHLDQSGIFKAGKEVGSSGGARGGGPEREGEGEEKSMAPRRDRVKRSPVALDYGCATSAACRWL